MAANTSTDPDCHCTFVLSSLFVALELTDLVMTRLASALRSPAENTPTSTSTTPPSHDFLLKKGEAYEKVPSSRFNIDSCVHYHNVLEESV